MPMSQDGEGSHSAPLPMSCSPTHHKGHHPQHQTGQPTFEEEVRALLKGGVAKRKLSFQRSS